MTSTNENLPAVRDFDFDGRAVRVVEKVGAAWFPAAEVCEILGIRFSRNAVARLDDDEGGTVLVNTLGGPQEVGAVNESGLYALILRSRKPAAACSEKIPQMGDVRSAAVDTDECEAAGNPFAPYAVRCFRGDNQGFQAARGRCCERGRGRPWLTVGARDAGSIGAYTRACAAEILASKIALAFAHACCGKKLFERRTEMKPKNRPRPAMTEVHPDAALLRLGDEFDWLFVAWLPVFAAMRRAENDAGFSTEKIEAAEEAERLACEFVDRLTKRFESRAPEPLQGSR